MGERRRSSSSASRIREATFLATFEHFQGKGRGKEREREDSENKKHSSCKFCGPHSLGSFGGVRLDVWIERVPSERVGSADRGGREMRSDEQPGRGRFYAFPYQYLARINKVSKKASQTAKPRTHRVDGKTTFEELNASPYHIEQSPKKYLSVGGKLEIQVDIKAWKEVKDAPDAVPVRAVIHDAPKRAWSLPVRRFMKPEDWKRDESNGAHSNAGEKSAVGVDFITDSKETASYLFREALSAKETQQGNSDSDAKLQVESRRFHFKKLGPLGTISEQKTRRLA